MRRPSDRCRTRSRGGPGVLDINNMPFLSVHILHRPQLTSSLPYIWSKYQPIGIIKTSMMGGHHFDSDLLPHDQGSTRPSSFKVFQIVKAAVEMSWGFELSRHFVATNRSGGCRVDTKTGIDNDTYQQQDHQTGIATERGNQPPAIFLIVKISESKISIGMIQSRMEGTGTWEDTSSPTDRFI